MKKLLGILVLCLVLTFSSSGISGEMNVFKKKIKLPSQSKQSYNTKAVLSPLTQNHDP